MKRSALLLLLPVVFSTGCLSGLLDHFSKPVNVAPDAWVPRVEGSDGMDSFATSKVESRLLEAKDSVVIGVTVSLRPQPRIEDVIDEEGNVTLPMIGEFRIAGLTTADAERAIRKEYIEKGVYKEVAVNVVCTSIRTDEAKTYSITGAVARRGRVPLTQGMTLREAVIAAGDCSDFANGKILITRKGITKQFNYRRIRKGLEQDPVIFEGDIIEVCE